MRRPVLKRGAAALALLLLVSIPGVVRAEDLEAAALREQLKELSNLVQKVEARLDKFDARLNKLEQQSEAANGAAATGAQVNSPPASSQQNDSAQVRHPAAEQSASRDAGAATQAQSMSFREGWFKMRDGMTQAEINQLLGPPQKTFELNGKTVWYYVYPGVGAASRPVAPAGL